LELPISKFDGFTVAGIAHERAQIAVADNAPNADQLSRQACELLDRFGDHRTALVARRDYASQLLKRGDKNEACAELIAVALGLVGVDRPAAGVTIALLVDSLANELRSNGSDLARAAYELGSAPAGLPLTAIESEKISSMLPLAMPAHINPAHITIRDVPGADSSSANPASGNLNSATLDSSNLDSSNLDIESLLLACRYELQPDPTFV
jgi:hypothetical protein